MRRSWAARCAAAVLLLQGVVLITFLLDPSEPPQRGRLWQALWALERKSTFIPLIALVIVGPPATWLAWSTRGTHRRWLAAGWILFGLAATGWFAHRVAVMLHLTWHYGLQ